MAEYSFGLAYFGLHFLDTEKLFDTTFSLFWLFNSDNFKMTCVLMSTFDYDVSNLKFQTDFLEFSKRINKFLQKNCKINMKHMHDPKYIFLSDSYNI